MSLFCFLILHYNSAEDTENCIASIKNLDRQNRIRIMIVDNHSPDKSGMHLLEKYKHDDQIKVIITDENYGFSRGNNIGCAAAVREWNPDYLIAANNDIAFVQGNFLYRIENKYLTAEFDILGPDIYDPNTGKSQSPMGLSVPDAPAVRRTILLNSIALSFPRTLLPLLEKRTPAKENNPGLNPHIPYENAVLQGSCLIYSRKYLQAKLSACENRLFFPETRFYYEEYIQALWCLRHHCRMLYDPSLLVHHMGGRSTAAAHKTDIARTKFRMQNIRDSARIYYRYLSSEP